MPIRERTSCARRGNSRPSTCTEPAWGRSRVASTLNRVVLPAPLRPSTARVWPAARLVLTSASASRSPYLRTSRSIRIASAGSGRVTVFSPRVAVGASAAMGPGHRLTAQKADGMGNRLADRLAGLADALGTAGKVDDQGPAAG